MNTIEAAIARAQANHADHTKPSAFYFDKRAREVVCYLDAEHGATVQAWHNGAPVQTTTLQRNRPDVLGDVCLTVPAGATIVVTDPAARRIVFV
jgi:hypothetical protein